MKEKIRQLAKGSFKYELPDLVLSEEHIELNAEAGERVTGELTACNREHAFMKGVVYSGSPLFCLKESEFSGEDNIIHYEFNAKDLNPGETVRGDITVVSDCGEQKVPFTVHVELPGCNTSMGKIRDLFQFANLAKTDWMEALKLFKSRRFADIFLKRDMKNTILYESLIKSVSTSHALEEFLIAVHKKLKINFSVDKTNFQYSGVEEAFMDKIIITKDNWGYAEMKVYSDAPFIVPEHKIIWADNFLGNTYPMEYVIKPEAMRPGKNFGRIILKTPYQTITVEITASLKESGADKAHAALAKQRREARLIQNYMDFRMNRIDVKAYVDNAEQLIGQSEPEGDSLFNELLLTQVCIVDGRMEQALELLNNLEEKKLDQNEKIQEYSAWLYLKALYSKDEGDIDMACEKITGFYNQGYRDWKILWYLLYLDKRYDSNRKQKLKDIMEHLRKGCHSPVLYLEAASIYNMEPVLLNDLDRTGIQAANWAIKADYLSREAAVQYTYLAGRRKNFNNLVYKGLTSLYDKYKSRDILTAICSLLIKGQKSGRKYLSWYEMGVMEQLRLTELHEYYMYSTEENMKSRLPGPLLHYFVFNSNLSDRKKAYLYANIISNKEENGAIYESYRKAIERFACRQLKEGRINESLAVIYEDIFHKEMIREKTAGELAGIMFRQEICCSNPNITGVYVLHKELCREQYVPLERGRAQIDLATEDARIILADEKDNRYASTIDYTLSKLLHMDGYAGLCLPYAKDNIMLLLHLSDQMENYNKHDDNSVMIKRCLLGADGLRQEYKGVCYTALISHFYDSFEGDKLDGMLREVDFELIAPQDRGCIIEYTIIRDIYETAAAALDYYGYEGVSVKRLLRLWARMIDKADWEEQNDKLTALGIHIFRSGKYDESLLRYLIRYYNGPTAEMYELWKAACGFDLNAAELEERLLAQILFTESGGQNAFGLFMSYYEHGSNKELIRAFLSYYSYKYLLHDRIVPAVLFDIIKREINYEENDTAVLALLKYYGSKERLTGDEQQTAEFHIHRFMDKGIILPFFKELKGKTKLPLYIANKQYIEYRTNPENKVTIHYIVENEENQENYISEPMKNVYMGIFVKEFVLFYNETLQYYITEESRDGENITESTTITLDSCPEEEENKYSLLNLMLITREMQDEKTLLEIMENYVKTEYAASELFKPL